jgi:hypothetical protein
MNYEIYATPLAFPKSNVIGKMCITNNKFKYTYNIWRESTDQYVIYVRNFHDSIIKYLVLNNICVIGDLNKDSIFFIKLFINPHALLGLI